MEIRAKALDFGAFLERTVGHYGYLIGTRGQTITQNMITYRLVSDRYQKYWTNIRLYSPLLLTGNPDKLADGSDAWKVVDCMGWFECFLNGGDIGNPLVANEFEYPDTQTGPVYALAKSEGLPNGEIATIPMDVSFPIAVGYDGHVGYFHKGVVYQSIGHRRGTLTTELSYGANNHQWDYWYYLPWLDYEYNGSSGGGEDVLQRGDKNDQVKAWQTSLLSAGYQMIGSTGTVYGADGSFGAATESATKKFQSDHGLAQTGKVLTADFCMMLTTLEKLRVDLKTVYDAAKIKIATLTTDLAKSNNLLIVANNKIKNAQSALM
jgi:hypothetical protein